MYQCYMKRGLSIMLLFAFFIGLSIMIPVPILAIPLPIIFAYSFFDTFNIYNSFDSESKIKDEYIWENYSSLNMDKITSAKKNGVLGIVLILVGAYMILNNVLLSVLRYIEAWELYDAIYITIKYIPIITISLLSIYIGIKFLSKKD